MKDTWLLALAVVLGMAQQGISQDHYAVLIGVETYDTSIFSNLRYAADDANEIGKELKRVGFKTTVMTHEADTARLQPTTPRKIIDTITAVARSCTSEDTLLIALSGHGVQFSDEDLLPSGVRETYFCPSDADLGDKATLLKISTVVELMKTSPSSRKLLLVDACQERILSKEGLKRGAKRIELGSVHENRRSVLSGMAVLFSCSSGQYSWEHAPLGHSVFSYHLLEYLKGKAQERYYDQGRLELNGLVSFVSKQTNDYVMENRLTPDGQYPVLRGDSTNWPLGNGMEPASETAVILSNRQIDDLYRQADSQIRNNDAKILRDFLANVPASLRKTSFPIAIRAIRETGHGYPSKKELATLHDLANFIDPDSEHTFLVNALFAREENDSETAKAFFSKAIQKNPLLVEAHLGLVWIETEDSGGNVATGTGYAKDLINRFPKDYRIHNAYGTRLFNEGRWEEGIQHLAKALELSPGHPLLWNNYAYGLAGADKQDEADAAYQKAAEFSWNTDAWVLALASAYFVESKPLRSLEFAQRAVELDGQEVEAWIYLLHHYEDNRNEYEARASRAIQTLSKPESKLGLLHALIEQELRANRVSDAEQRLVELEKHANGDIAKIGIAKALVLRAKGSKKEALVVINEYIAVVRNQKSASLNLPYAEFVKKSLEK